VTAEQKAAQILELVKRKLDARGYAQSSDNATVAIVHVVAEELLALDERLVALECAAHRGRR
jgi:hypothetical protein